MATGDIDQQDLLSAYDTNEDEEEEDDGSSMTLVEHLEELRWRIFKCLIAVAVFTIVAFIFRVQLMTFLTAPFPKEGDALTHGKLVVMGLTEGFTVFLLISIAAGVILSLPVILYQTWAFIAPGLYANEKKYAVPFIFIGVVLFVIGVSLGYIVLRYPVEWLVTFASNSFVELISADSYFTFVAFFILVFGLVFELPLVLTFMAKVGWVNSATLRNKRAAAHVGMWVAACFATPGADLYSPIFIGVSLSCLYELTILFIHFTVDKQTEAIE
jgi:sec-independent protein translocase protein TatC